MKPNTSNFISDPDPLAVYLLDGCTGAEDVSDNHNNGEVGSISYTSGPDGTLRGAMAFSGSSDSYVHMVNNNGSLDVFYSMSVFMYVYIESEGFVMNYGRDESRVGFYYEGSQLQVRFRERDQGIGLGETVDATLDQAKWYQVGVTYDYETAEAKMYVDGAEVDSKTFSEKRTLSTNDDLYFGANGNTDLSDFRGAVSCVYVYDRAITTEEIIATATCPERMSYSNTEFHILLN